MVVQQLMNKLYFYLRLVFIPWGVTVGVNITKQFTENISQLVLASISHHTPSRSPVPGENFIDQLDNNFTGDVQQISH